MGALGRFVRAARLGGVEPFRRCKSERRDAVEDVITMGNVLLRKIEWRSASFLHRRNCPFNKLRLGTVVSYRG